jgi:hypothetical protein
MEVLLGKSWENHRKTIGNIGDMEKYGKNQVISWRKIVGKP